MPLKKSFESLERLVILPLYKFAEVKPQRLTIAPLQIGYINIIMYAKSLSLCTYI